VIIKPPSSEYELPIVKEVIPRNWEENRRIELFLNVKSWKCSECGTTMFGRVLACVYCKVRYRKHVPRPTHYTKENGA
jgi:hypothetical protein